MKITEIREGGYLFTSQRPDVIRARSTKVNITLPQLEVMLPFSDGKSLATVAREMNASLSTLDGQLDLAYEQNNLKGTNKKTRLALLLRQEELLNELALIGFRTLLKEMWENKTEDREHASEK